MVILLQLCLFALAAFIRGRYLFGKHLKKRSDDSNALEHIRRSKHGIISRHIGLERAHNGIPFIIRRERWYHRAFKALGIATEIQIGNQAFDHTYLIITDSPQHLEQALHSATFKDDLLALFALPIKSLHATSSRIWCAIQRQEVREDWEHFSKHLSLLAVISSHTQKRSGYAEITGGGNRLGYWALLFICAHAGILTWAGLGYFTTLIDGITTQHVGKLIFMGLGGGLILAASWLAIIILMFQGTSWINWVLVDFLLCGLIGLALSGILIAREINIHFNQPAPIVHEVSVLAKRCTLKCSKSCGRRCTRRSTYSFTDDAQCGAYQRPATMAHYQQVDYICASRSHFTYTLHTTHWVKPETYNFPTDPSLFDATVVGQALYIPIYSGALGAQWLKHKELKTQPY